MGWHGMTQPLIPFIEPPYVTKINHAQVLVDITTGMSFAAAFAQRRSWNRPNRSSMKPSKSKRLGLKGAVYLNGCC